MPLALAAALAGVLAGQPPALEITAPKTHTIVAPGDTVAVLVSSPTQTPVRGVMVGGEELGLYPAGTTLPARVSVTVPRTAAAGWHRLTAMAVTESGAQLSAAIELDVERQDAPVSLYVRSPSMPFELPGETLPTQLLARFRDGASIDAHASARVTYTSSDDTVASVNREGIVTAIGPGQATITISYRSPSGLLHLPVPVSVAVPALVPSAYTLVFPAQAAGTPSGPKRLSLTNRTAGPVRVIEINTTPFYSQVNDCPAALPAGGSCTVSVVLTPGDPGDAPGELEIASSANALPLRIPLKGARRPR